MYVNTSPQASPLNAAAYEQGSVSAARIDLPQDLCFQELAEVVAPSANSSSPIWVAIAALFVSAAILGFQVLKHITDRKREMTIRMFEKWTSASYHDHRAKADEVYTRFKAEYIKSGLEEKIPIEKLSLMPDASVELGIIEHFFDDLGRLATGGALDRKLSRLLFQDIADYWISAIHRFDWSNSKDADWYSRFFKPHTEGLYEFWGVDRQDRSLETRHVEDRESIASAD